MHHENTHDTGNSTENPTRCTVHLGQVVATPGAIQALQRFNVLPTELLSKHASGDWGELCAEDQQANHYALQHGERILSNYPLGDGCRLWIITEWDRSVTTLLLPEEY